LAFATKISWQIVFPDLLEEVGFETFTEDGDLGDGDFIEPWFNETPDGGEEVWSLNVKRVAAFSDPVRAMTFFAQWEKYSH
jgi:hypothetical protein